MGCARCGMAPSEQAEETGCKKERYELFFFENEIMKDSLISREEKGSLPWPRHCHQVRMNATTATACSGDEESDIAYQSQFRDITPPIHIPIDLNICVPITSFVCGHVEGIVCSAVLHSISCAISHAISHAIACAVGQPIPK